MKNPIKMDDLGVPHGTPIFGNTHIEVEIFDEEDEDEAEERRTTFCKFVCSTRVTFRSAFLAGP